MQKKILSIFLSVAMIGTSIAPATVLAETADDLEIAAVEEEDLAGDEIVEDAAADEAILEEDAAAEELAVVEEDAVDQAMDGEVTEESTAKVPEANQLSKLVFGNSYTITDAYQMTPAFSPEVSEYTVYVSDSEKMFYVDATLADTAAGGSGIKAKYYTTLKREQNATIYSGSPKGLSGFIGQNGDGQELVLKVNDMEAYTIHVVRVAAATSLALTNAGEEISLSPSFKSSTYDYSAILDEEKAALPETIGVTVKGRSGAAATVNGTAVTLGTESNVPVNWQDKAAKLEVSISYAAQTEPTVYNVNLKARVPATGLTLDQSAIEVTPKDEKELVATVSPEGTTDQITWTSSNEDVVKVVEGKITAVAVGTADVTAQVNDLTAVCSVTVKRADITALQEAMDRANALNKEDYVQGEDFETLWNAVKEECEEGEEVIEFLDTLSQTTVDEVTEDINKAIAALPEKETLVVEDQTVVYNGKTQTIGDYPTYKDEACTEEVAAVNAGTYYVHAVAEATDTTKALDKVVKLVIAKADSKVTLKSYKVTYNGKAKVYPKAKTTVVGSKGKVVYSYYSDAKCTKKVAAAKVKNAGSYYVKATVAADANYNKAQSKAVKLTIAAADAKTKVAVSSKTYTVKAVKAKAQTFNIGAKAKKGVALSYKSSNTKAVKVDKKGKVTVLKGAKKGTYKITVKPASKNYTGTKTVKVVIK